MHRDFPRRGWRHAGVRCRRRRVHRVGCRTQPRVGRRTQPRRVLGVHRGRARGGVLHADGGGARCLGGGRAADGRLEGRAGREEQ